MHITDIILKKRSGEALTKEEIDFFIKGYVDGSIPDYQASALLMAIWFNGMNPQETTDLTLSMVASGDTVDLSGIDGIKVDKHSTGGVADTTTLVAAPLVAACGGRVAKMSGRGLGHTGGTLDKLESIPGLSIEQPMEIFQKLVNTIGLSVIGQTGNLVPADKKLYALRDVTVTVDNMSLIAGSIMSKKIASGADAIVLDVKTGSGAFMKTAEDSVELAKSMVEIGKLAGRATVALVTDMNQPLGNAVGNALEVQEAIEILRGEHPGDLKDVAFALSAWMLRLAGLADDEAAAMKMLTNALESGAALDALSRMIEAQGGDPKICEDTSKLPRAGKLISVKAERDGWISEMDNTEIGISAMLLGAGRQTKADVIDPAVGLWMKKRIGEQVAVGDELAVFHVNEEKNLDEALKRFKAAVKISGEKPDKLPLIYHVVE
ncbi:MAG: pyrimidine-nucleoside phosphorylase [Spirochaetales bacterium]|uniref:thymidine phosphorylase n=1 Tax=Candidatus Thalassospirochaeta sargassi TaxID=3119039 RepID=A0AAJ1MJB5_9SPIO|nr:pyrimidine-nucleoside phosphorylase [Spirochaetales bacterium]